jgi:predicted phosphodiesterase
MNIQILSDLHFEFFRADSQHLGKIQIHPDADVIVLAGDIDRSLYSLKRAGDLAQESGKPVIWTAGNHEFYSCELQDTLNVFNTEKEKFKAYGVHALLEGQYCDINNVRFIGGILWTNFMLYNNTIRMSKQDIAIDIGQNSLNDFRVIQNGNKTFTARDSLALHQKDYANIKQSLELPFDGKKVVVTHHGPHKESVHAKYRPPFYVLNSPSFMPGENSNWMLNPAFCSHLPELVKMANLWIHGHTHESLDYMAEGCHVVANPRGYPLSSDGVNVRWENSSYNPLKVVTL